VVVLLLGFASQASRLQIKPPDKESLVPGSRVRADEETIVNALGAGWTAPYEALITARGRSGRSHQPVLHLVKVAAWQRQLARDPAVAAAFGPSQVLEQAPRIRYHGRIWAPTDAQVVTMIDDASSTEVEVAGLTINLSGGTDAARVSLIERTRNGAGHPGDPLRARLEHAAARLERETGTHVLVGGPAANLQDFTAANTNRLPLLILALAIVTFVILALILRSLVIAAVAVALNVLTIGAALGILVLCFQGSAPLGGAGSLDAVTTPAIISVSFGLAIDYEVFLLARIRERYRLDGNLDAAIEHGLMRTAGIITGAALIMTAVFVAFATAKIMNLREFGVGLTAAVLLDATLVRLVLLPAAIRALGALAWWVPWRSRRAGATPAVSAGTLVGGRAAADG